LDHCGKRIEIAWAVGFLASAVGLIASYQVDFPSGPAIVCSLGLFLLLFGGWRALRPARGSAREAAGVPLVDEPASR
jgi:ABC-type Mn2+/Zn2+ transport system permease subunit